VVGCLDMLLASNGWVFRAGPRAHAPPQDYRKGGEEGGLEARTSPGRRLRRTGGLKKSGRGRSADQRSFGRRRRGSPRPAAAEPVTARREPGGARRARHIGRASRSTDAAPPMKARRGGRPGRARHKYRAGVRLKEHSSCRLGCSEGSSGDGGQGLGATGALLFFAPVPRRACPSFQPTRGSGLGLAAGGSACYT
jgi:hypothetical protein